MGLVKTENLENFYGENFYTFTNYSCICNEDIVYEKPNIQPRKIFKLYSDTRKAVKFAYAAKRGLVRIKSNGTVEQDNILGVFIGLVNASQKKIESFLAENGFLFPLTADEYETFEFETFIAVIKHMKATVELLSEIGENKNHKKMIDLALSLIMDKPIHIKTKVMETEYTNSPHSILDLIETPPISLSPERQREEKRGDTFFCIENTITDEPYKFEIQRYYDIVAGYTSMSDFDRKLTMLFVNYEADDEKRKAIDILYFHRNNINMPYNDKLKESILQFSKKTLADEINHNLRGIYPQYNETIMEPSWKVDSLMSALYFSIFYTKPNLEIYRPCAYSRCTNYFTVSTTSKKKKYCCDRCANNAAQATYRKRTKNK